MPTPYDNREVVEGFETLPDGDYPVDGIEDFYSKDTQDYPVFTPQGDQMVARLHLRLVDRSKIGPAMSGTYEQLVMLLRAFGGDSSNLPTGETAGFLLDIQKRANEAGKKQIAKVDGGKGYAKFVSGMHPETEKMYTWQFYKAVNTDKNIPEPVRFIEKENTSRKGGKYTSSRVVFLFKLVGDMYGRPTNYDGYVLRVYVDNPFVGKVYSNTKNRWEKFVSLFCPMVDTDWEWQADSEKSPYGTNELENPLTVYVDHAAKLGRKAIGIYKINERGYADVDMLDWVQSEATDVDNRDEKAFSESSQPKELLGLVELIDELSLEATSEKAFEETKKNDDKINLTFTPSGLSFAKENLSKAWDKAGLPLNSEGKRVIASLSGQQCGDLEKALREMFGKEKRKVNEALTESGSF